MAELETSTLVDLLRSMTDHHEHISKMPPIDPDDPKLYWILRDADFKVWESANNSQVLWIFGGPSDCAMPAVSSLIAKQENSRRNDAGFYFSCSIRSSDASTTFTHSFLRHILNDPNADQRKLITETFLSTLLLNIIQRNRSRFEGSDSSGITVKEILNKNSGGELLQALTEAVVEIKTISDKPIIIDGIDKIGPDGARFLKRFCSHTTTKPMPKILVTSSMVPLIKEIVDGARIEYDKERQGLATSCPLVILSN